MVTKKLPCLSPLKQIQADNEYTANLYVQTSTNKYKIRRAVNGKPITVDDGKGAFTFKALKPGKKHWTDIITFRKYGKDTTITLKQPYEVLPRK